MEQREAARSLDWVATRQILAEASHELVGLPLGIARELELAVKQFRREMKWHQRVGETLIAGLSAVPPILGVTYALLTVNPVAGGGLWIRLGSILGTNDLWALVSIPASAGLGEQDRRQLERMISPVFKLWLERRSQAITSILADTVCQPIWRALDRIPLSGDPRFGDVEVALAGLVEGA